MSINRGMDKEDAASLVAWWLRILLPMQETLVRALVREDPTCHGAAKPACHNYWAHVTQLLKPMHLETVLCNKTSHHNEKPGHRNEEEPLLSNEDPMQPKINKQINKRRCSTYIQWTMKSHKKEWNNAICSNMDEPTDCHTEWSKSDRERQISYDIAYTWSLKKRVQMNLRTKQK